MRPDNMPRPSAPSHSDPNEAGVLSQLEELREAVGEDPEGDCAVRKIIAAVAELIAADEEYNAAKTEFFLAHIPSSGPIARRYGEAKDRRSAALARCKGGAA